MPRLDRRTFLLSAGANVLWSEVAAARGGGAKPAENSLPEAWIRAEVWPLWPGTPPGGGHFAAQPLPADSAPIYVRNVAMPDLHLFRPAQPNGSTVLIIPGGGYRFVSVGNEGVEVAARLTARGFTALVLTYRLPAEGWAGSAEVPLQDAQRAMRLIRSRHGELGVPESNISVLGFSAGGHVAATLATAYDARVYSPVDAADTASALPLSAALIYPVITMAKPWTHAGSREALLGADPSQAQVAAHSPELHVSAGTPPCFLAHACDDDSVPVENSLMFFAALRRAQRPAEAHLFQEGKHAFGIGRPGTPTQDWIDLYSLWLQRLVA
jgi:acetyl esterase/lipase